MHVAGIEVGLLPSNLMVAESLASFETLGAATSNVRLAEVLGAGSEVAFLPNILMVAELLAGFEPLEAAASGIRLAFAAHYLLDNFVEVLVADMEVACILMMAEPLAGFQNLASGIRVAFAAH